MNELQAQLELKKQMTREELQQQGGGYLSLGQQYNLNKYQLELGQPQRGQSTTHLHPKLSNGKKKAIEVSLSDLHNLNSPSFGSFDDEKRRRPQLSLSVQK